MIRLSIILLFISNFVFSQNHRIFVNKTKTTNISKSKVSNISYDKKIILVSKRAGDYDNVHDALESITDASSSKRYTIKVDADTWHLTQANQFNTSGSFYNIFRTKDYVDIEGAGIDRTVFFAELPDTAVETLSYYSTVDFYGENEISGITVKAKNVKYAVHDDFASHLKYTYVHDCKFISLGNLDYYNYWLPTVKPLYYRSYGNGMDYGRSLRFDNVYFYGEAGFHTARNLSKKTKVEFYNCVFIPNNYTDTGDTTSAVNLTSLQSLQPDSVYFYDCILDSLTYSYYVYQSDTSLVPYDLAEIKVVNNNTNYTFHNYPHPNFTSIGSLMIIATDSIKYISGVPEIIRNPVIRNDSLISKLEVGEHPLCHDLRMGVRLGDCSITNKTLILKINGTDETVVFNEDFTDKTNSYILDFINNQLTGATATLYNWAGEYKP